MEETLTLLLAHNARFEYLLAKKEYDKLLDMMAQDREAGERFRHDHLGPRERLLKTMLHKCDEINLAFEGWSSLFLPSLICFCFQIGNQSFQILYVSAFICF